MIIELDEYEAANLLWLLRVARRLGLDTGDWLGQLVRRFEDHPPSWEPNWPASVTDDVVERLLTNANK